MHSYPGPPLIHCSLHASVHTPRSNRASTSLGFSVSRKNQDLDRDLGRLLSTSTTISVLTVTKPSCTCGGRDAWDTRLSYLCEYGGAQVVRRPFTFSPVSPGLVRSWFFVAILLRLVLDFGPWDMYLPSQWSMKALRKSRVMGAHEARMRV